MLTDTLAHAVALFGCALFIQAGFSKLRRPAAYEQVVSAYLRRPVGSWPVRIIGVIEVDAALACLLPPLRPAGAAACALLLLGYAILMAREVAAGHRTLRCGCAGPASEVRVSYALVARNAVIALPLIGLAATSTPSEFMFNSALMLAMPLTAVLLLSYVTVEGLIANRQRWRGIY